MILETVLAYVHLLAILTWVVFLASTAALARTEWLNAAVVDRLVVVDRIANVAALLVLASGLARWLWGIKGVAWMGGQPLFWGKVALFALMGLAAWRTQRTLRAWQRALHSTGGLPAADEVAVLRRRVMRASHLMLLVPLLAVMLARGIGTV
ncbi:DUF2214 family protein [Ideonella sp. A 288]|uniref:DUF2214 family protein n=1 Tax=Ideonella sp. A 288 TaxID=1962181 RepID=UPI000B4BC098|nr:DUF2214 family protein [Ideonella sp. A 288]